MNTPFAKKSSALPIVALIFFVAAFAGAALYVKPTWDEVSIMQADLSQSTEERNQLNSQLVDLQKLQQEIQSSSEVIREKTLSAIPEKFEQDKLIADLTRIAVENDIIMNSVSFGAGGSGLENQVARASINANLTGNQSALLGFLRDIENNSRKILVNSITVQFGETDLGVSRVNFNVNMEVYYQGII